VTGGAGFIGSHTVDMLVDKGYEVTVLDNLEPQVHGRQKPKYLNPKARYIFGDIRNRSAWVKALNGVEGIIHLAASVGVGQSTYMPVKYLRTNTIGTSILYDILLKNKALRKRIKKIVVASSKSIYGEGAYYCKKDGVVYPPLRSIEQLKNKDWEVHCPICGEYVTPIGIKEDKPPQNLSTYALSKYDTERLAVNYGITLDVPTVAFRYFNVYGPRQSLSNPYTGVIAIFLSRIKNKKEPVLFEDGMQQRDFIYVNDIAAANVIGIESKVSGVYNVGTGKPTSLIQMISKIEELLDVKIEPKITGEFRFGDNRHDFADITKARKELKFSPKWPLEKGLKELIDWSAEEEAKDRFDKAERERKKYLSQ